MTTLISKEEVIETIKVLRKFADDRCDLFDDMALYLFIQNMHGIDSKDIITIKEAQEAIDRVHRQYVSDHAPQITWH